MNASWIDQTLKAMQNKRILSFAIALLTGISLALGEVGLKASARFNFLGSQPAIAQIVIPQEVWKQVYQRLPDLPRENQYISRETGQVASENTLISRLIRYHLYLKNRPPTYRLDWKLTLADYLGVNEVILEPQYVGNDTLRENPLEGDRAAIKQLNRAQRDALVETLVTLFNPRYQEEIKTPAPSTAPTPSTSPNPGVFRLPKPGDAQLLKP